MSEQIKRLLKDTWTLLGTEEQKQFEKTLAPDVAKQYVDGMFQLENDLELQAELGIGII